jgi:rod shape-determining protein MreC
MNRDKSTRGGLARQAFVFVLLMIVSVASILVSSNTLTDEPKEVGLTVFAFVQNIFNQTGKFATDAVNSIGELADLKVKYTDSLKRLQDLESLERSNAEILQENSRLRDQLSYSKAIPYTYTAAEIIAKDPENTVNTIVINKGSRDGIQKNMPVVAYQDGMQGLVGKVIEVGLNSSIVLPVFDTNNFVAARLERTRYEGLVSGTGFVDKSLVMKFVNKRAKDEIEKSSGDLVISSGMRSIYPKGVNIARVKSIRAKDYETSIEIELEPVIDFSRLEYVFVLHADGSTQTEFAAVSNG